MSAATHIYGLIDPRTNELRYVGKTRDPASRLREHLLSCKLRRKTHCNHWLRSVMDDGARPEIFVLEDVPSDRWEEAEQFWIGYARMLGADLTNHTLGGYGANNWPQALRRQRGEALRGRKREFSPEHRAKIAAINRARNASPEWRAKVSLAAKRRCARDPEKMKIVSALGRAVRDANGPFYKTCDVCGAPFTAKTKPARFCSSRCNQRMHGPANKRRYRERLRAAAHV